MNKGKHQNIAHKRRELEDINHSLEIEISEINEVDWAFSAQQANKISSMKRDWLCIII